MKRVLSTVVAGTALVAAALPAPTAHAAWGSAVGTLCAGTVTWQFTPPLSASATTGSVTQAWSGVCGLAVVGAATDPPGAGEFHSLFGFDTTSTGGYSGDCTLATITMNGVSHLLVGGRVAVERNLVLPWPEAGASVVRPDATCPIATTTGDRVVSSATVNVSPS